MNRQNNKINCCVQYYAQLIIVYLICVLLGVCLYLSSHQASQNSTETKTNAVGPSTKSSKETTYDKTSNVQTFSNPAKAAAPMKISEVVFSKSALAATSGKSALAATSDKPKTSIKYKKSARRYYKSRKYRSLAARKNSKEIKPVSENSNKLDKGSHKRVVKLGKTFMPIQIQPEKSPNMNIIELHEVVVPVSMVNLVTNQ